MVGWHISYSACFSQNLISHTVKFTKVMEKWKCKLSVCCKQVGKPGLLKHLGGRMQRYEIVSEVKESVPGDLSLYFESLWKRAVLVYLYSGRPFLLPYYLGGGWERFRGTGMARIQTPNFFPSKRKILI